MLANRGVFIFLAPRGSDLVRSLSHKPLQPNQEDQQVSSGLSLHTPLSAWGLLRSALSQPHLEHISHPIHVGCRRLHFPWRERERKNLTEGIVYPLFP